MNDPEKPRGPLGKLDDYAKERFESEGSAYDLYRKGHGPAVLIVTEIPGISPRVLGFADRVAALGCSVVLPDLFGVAGKDPEQGELASRLYALRTVASLCIRREFNMFAAGRSSPIVRSLRQLAAAEHARCGGPGVGAVGMCFTGGFALAMAVEPSVIAPVLSQPSLPFGLGRRHERAIDCSADELRIVADRCARERLEVLGLRFRGDPFVPEQRFDYLKEKLGDAFVAVTLEQEDGHPGERLRPHHSVLTGALVDAPREPTRAALDRVLELLRRKLLAAPA